MTLWMYQLASSLTFSDLQKSMHSQLRGETADPVYRNTLLCIVASVALLALVLRWRQRRKLGGPPNNVRKLGWELSRSVPFPAGSRLLLWWVSWSTRVPVAVLLISGETFDASVESWSKQPTFAVAREWGRGRLLKLKHVLFDCH
ncbi:MAG: hypothetical protein FWD61_03090 [Phycisphaerales bacterium]|nr:hypothetical protein [Phycisphaerales bacterium]